MEAIDIAKQRLAKIEAINQLNQVLKSDQFQSALRAMEITNFSKEEIINLIQEFVYPNV